MHGYYGHALKIVRQDRGWVYAQFHLISSDQGTKNLTADEAEAECVGLVYRGGFG